LNSLRNRDIREIGGEWLCYLPNIPQLEGNVSDNSTLEGMIDELRLKTSYGQKKAIVVMDAGIATESITKRMRVRWRICIWDFWLIG
jgi:hypothetical protein